MRINYKTGDLVAPYKGTSNGRIKWCWGVILKIDEGECLIRTDTDIEIWEYLIYIRPHPFKPKSIKEKILFFFMKTFFKIYITINKY